MQFINGFAVNDSVAIKLDEIISLQVMHIDFKDNDCLQIVVKSRIDACVFAWGDEKELKEMMLGIIDKLGGFEAIP